MRFGWYVAGVCGVQCQFMDFRCKATVTEHYRVLLHYSHTKGRYNWYLWYTMFSQSSFSCVICSTTICALCFGYWHCPILRQCYILVSVIEISRYTYGFGQAAPRLTRLNTRQHWLAELHTVELDPHVRLKNCWRNRYSRNGRQI